MSGRVYIASGLENAERARAVARFLEGLGYTITYAWWKHGSVQRRGAARIREVAKLEAQGVMSADVVLVLLPGGRGTHTELGIAIGSGKRVVLDAGPNQLDLHDDKTCAFYLHPLVAIVRGRPEFNPWLSALEAARQAALRSKRAKKAAAARKKAALLGRDPRGKSADWRPRTPAGRVYTKKTPRRAP